MIVRNVIITNRRKVMKGISALYCFLLLWGNVAAQEEHVICPSLLECKYRFVASEDTVDLVTEHLKSCEKCRSEYENNILLHKVNLSVGKPSL